MHARLVATVMCLALVAGVTGCQGGELGPPASPSATTAPEGTPTTAPPPTTVGKVPPSVSRTYPGGGPMRPNPYFRVAAGQMPLSPDGGQVAAGIGTGEERKVQLWDVTNGDPVRTLPGRSALAWSPDGRTMAVEGQGMTVDLVDVDSGSVLHTLRGHTAPEVMDAVPTVTAAAFSPDGRRLVTGGDDGAVLLWEVATGAQQERLDGASGVMDNAGLAWSPDGVQVAVASDEHTEIWEPGRGVTAVIPTPLHTAEATWSPDGSRLVTSGRPDLGSSGEASVDVYDTSDFRRVASHPVGSFAEVAFSPDGHTLAFTDYETRGVYTWTMGREPARLVTGSPEVISDLQWGAGGRVLLVGSTNIGIMVFDPVTGELRRTLTA